MVDATSKRDDPPWLEDMMDQAKLEALAEAVMAAQRALKNAAERWVHTNDRLNSLPQVSSEDDFNKEMSKALDTTDPRPAGQIRSYVKEWASKTASRQAAKEAVDLANEEMKKCSEAARAALEQLVAFIRNSK
jgi:hypothetical protein